MGKQDPRNQGRQQGQQQGQQNVHGEGNYAASRDYNERTKRFVESGQVDEAARAAEPGSEAEALQMQAAEAEGKRHAKEEDPALLRKASKDRQGSGGADDVETHKPGKDEE